MPKDETTSRRHIPELVVTRVVEENDKHRPIVLKPSQVRIGLDFLGTNLGTATSLSVEKIDYRPKLSRWKPIPALAVPPRIDSKKLRAIPPAPYTIQKVGHEH